MIKIIKRHSYFIIFLSDNPLVCDKNLKWLYTNQKLPVIFEGRCEEPEKLRKKSLLLLKVSDLE